MLRNEFSVIFEEVIVDWSSFTYDVVDDDLDVQPEVSIEPYARGRGEIDACDGNVPTVLTNTQWPESWIEPVRTIRALQRPTFLDFVRRNGGAHNVIQCNGHRLRTPPST